MDRKSILITGACGFIGSNLVEFLLSQDVATIVILDNLSHGSNYSNVEEIIKNQYKRVHFVKGEYGDVHLVKNILEMYKIQWLIHLAAETHVDRSYSTPEICATNNVVQLISLLNACVEYGSLSLFLQMSTDEVYGDHQDTPYTEMSPLKPTNPYSASKAAAEQYVSSYFYSYRLPTIVVRCNNVYGPRQCINKLVPKCIKHILSRESFPIHGNGLQSRNWIYVKDVCTALWSISTKGTIGQVYNIGTKNEYSVMDIARKLENIVQEIKDTSIVLTVHHTLDRPYNDKWYRVDTSKIRDELNWKENISFYEGLKETVSWYLENATAKDTHSKKKKKEKFLVFGHKGWIAQSYCKELTTRGIDWVGSSTKPGIDKDWMVEEEIRFLQPTHIVSLLGRTHGPGCNTVDYLEQGVETLKYNVRDNLYAPVFLAMLCREKDIHFSYLGTGCIFEQKEDDPKEWKEEDEPNFFGSSYSIVKGFTDRLMHSLEGVVLNIRIRMPISAERNDRNFVTKITRYDKVVNVANSMSVLPELIPIMIQMAIDRKTGTINMVNPRPISHNEILELYKMYVDPTFSIKNFTLEEQNLTLKAGRSNCKLSTEKLQNYCCVQDSIDAVTQTMIAMKKK